MDTKARRGTIINGFCDDLICIANPAPFRGDVMMQAYMPGADQYEEVLSRARNGAVDHAIAFAYWKDSVDPEEKIEPTLFVFVSRSSDSMFSSSTGLTVEYLFHSMEALARQFIARWNISAKPPTTVLDRLVLVPT